MSEQMREAGQAVGIPEIFAFEGAKVRSANEPLTDGELSCMIEERGKASSEEYRRLKEQAAVLCRMGMSLALCGAETRLIIQCVSNMAKDLGCSESEIALTREGIILRLHKGRETCVEFREIKHFAINMTALTNLYDICTAVHEGRMTDLEEINTAITSVKSFNYNKNALILIEAVAGACFAFLNGGGPAVCAAVFTGGLLLMYIRFLLISRGFFDAFVFMVSAFAGSMLSMITAKFFLHLDSASVMLAGTAVTLLIVPGFPIINGFLDIFKGYVPVGLSRLMIAGVLIISASIGLLFTTYTGQALTDLIPLSVLNGDLTAAIFD